MSFRFFSIVTFALWTAPVLLWAQSSLLFNRPLPPPNVPGQPQIQRPAGAANQQPVNIQPGTQGGSIFNDPRNEPQGRLFVPPTGAVGVQQFRRRPVPVLPTRRLSDTGYYVPIPPPQQIRKHDIITVRVDITARMESDGNSEMRRSANYDLALTDWIIVNWFRWIKPSPQSNGDPRISGSLNRQNRAEGDVDTSERLQFNIATEVRDIYPNGNLLLGGGNFVRTNNEVWKVSMTGICRPKDIGPNNTILSSNILNLKIDKAEHGQVRDAYRRGWFTRWFERYHPF